MKLIRTFLRSKKGAALVEYALLVAGIAIVAAAAVSLLGHKTSDLIGTSATIIPGVSGEDNNPISSGRLIETSVNDDGNIATDIQAILDKNGQERVGDNLGFDTGELPDLVKPYPLPAGP